MTTILTDEDTAPAVRLCFSTPDPDLGLTRAIELGGFGADPSAAQDDQGVPLGFCLPAAETGSESASAAAAALGAVAVYVPDTMKAREFYKGLFGLDFHKVGDGDFWWASSGPGFGVFPAGFDVTNPTGKAGGLHTRISPFFVQRDHGRATAQVRDLGGATLETASMGPFGVCGCRDDQGTSFGLLWDPRA